MYLSPYPCKIAFVRQFKKFLKSTEPFTTVLDFASADAKYAFFFHNKEYHGADISTERIENGKKKIAHMKTAHLYHDNLLNPQSAIIQKTFDLVVSTHTLAHINNIEDITTALKNLTDRVSMGGSMIIHCGKRELEICQKIASCFQSTFFHTYKGSISMWYEKILRKIFKQDYNGKAKDKGNFFIHLTLLSASFILSFFDSIGTHNNYLILFKKKQSDFI